MIFATFQLNVPPDCNIGFRQGMTWDDIRELLSSLLMEEIHTPPGKNYPLHYVKKGFFKN